MIVVLQTLTYIKLTIMKLYYNLFFGNRTFTFRLLIIIVSFIVLHYLITNALRLYMSLDEEYWGLPAAYKAFEKGKPTEPKPVVTYIKGLTGSAGPGTKELHGFSMWGVAPLWRIVPSPNTVLSLQDLIPSVCWAFKGSKGELIIYLMQPEIVESISVEHVKPDTSRSAPKSFVVYGVLEDDYEIEILEDRYRKDGPAKQFFHISSDDRIFKEVKFKVLTNQGNKDYTCLYKIRLYSHNTDEVHY